MVARAPASMHLHWYFCRPPQLTLQRERGLPVHTTSYLVKPRSEQVQSPPRFTPQRIADEVVVMRNGKVVEQGPKDQMFRPPHHPYTDLLLSSVPEMDPDWLTHLLEERSGDTTSG